MNDETKLEFPCDFSLKIMGKQGTEFEAAVVPIIHKHVPDLGEGAISFRESAEGNYVSMTVQFNASSQEQLDAIYIDLTNCEFVIMAL